MPTDKPTSSFAGYVENRSADASFYLAKSTIMMKVHDLVTFAEATMHEIKRLRVAGTPWQTIDYERILQAAIAGCERPMAEADILAVRCMIDPWFIPHRNMPTCQQAGR